MIPPPIIDPLIAKCSTHAITAPADVKFDTSKGDAFGGIEVFIRTTLTTSPIL